eukprot:TRINITY_DN13203_c0_g1_i1.p1 TRINITY_DN13203_c0_g1~~TRINITY_DN13203_c0_g1_i1.p1  ORF type:complete len:287 (-),score=65.75 TRINITY_DN13203_c0_g1_i1:93-953(-)
MKELKGKLVLITGAGSGIGRLMAVEFAAEGSNLLLWDIQYNLLEETQKIILADSRVDKSIKIELKHCDLSKKDQIYKAAEETLATHEAVDILVNNAGIVSGKKFLDVDDSMIERTMNVNIMAHMWLAKKFLPPMIKQNSGHIVSIASAAGLNGVAGLADYCASKFAAVGFDESIRLELQKQNINVKTTVVCPYYINTGMFDGVSTKINWLMPILDPHHVVSEIMRAVKNDIPVLYLPRLLYYVQLLKVLLPTSVSDWMNKVLGISSSMDEFKGRGSNWAVGDKKTN